MTAATAGDENPPRTRGPIDDKVIVGRIGVQTGAAPYQSGPFQRGKTLGDKDTSLIEEVGARFAIGLGARRAPLYCPRRF